MRHLCALGLLTAAMATLPCATQAQPAYTSKDVHLRAGPARQYLSIAILAAGFQISVQGCLGDYTWCDVIAGPNRGWVYAANIVYPYRNAYVPVLTYGAVIGIAVVGFIIGDYWGDHYRDRPWYADRYRRVPRPVAPPTRYGPRPPPPPAAVPGPGGFRPPPSTPPAPGPGGYRPPPLQPPGAAPRGHRPPPSPRGEPGAGRPPDSHGTSPGGPRRPPPRGDREGPRAP